ncbi:MAG: hypothetical protein WD069_18085 [Planctomycetales bacterium]
MKTVKVVVSGTTPLVTREVELHPGCQTDELLAVLGLYNYFLSEEGAPLPLQWDAELHGIVRDGGTLRATPRTTMSAGLKQKVIELLAAIGVDVRSARHGAPLPDYAPQKPVIGRNGVRVSRPSRRPATVRGKIVVAADRRPLWELRGWRREGRRLVGAYRTKLGSFAGEIDLSNKQQPDFYIVNPPKKLLDGPHGPCFRKRGDGRFWIHFSRALRTSTPVSWASRR